LLSPHYLLGRAILELKLTPESAKAYAKVKATHDQLQAQAPDTPEPELISRLILPVLEALGWSWSGPHVIKADRNVFPDLVLFADPLTAISSSRGDSS